MLFTIGPTEGEASGTVSGLTVAHASLDPNEYEQVLRAGGFAEVITALDDPECGHHSVVLATAKIEDLAKTQGS